MSIIKKTVGAKLSYCEREIGITSHAQWYVTFAPTEKKEKAKLASQEWCS
jgi:hypothetical protein